MIPKVIDPSFTFQKEVTLMIIFFLKKKKE